MSRPQEHHQPFFHFGNTFRVTSPKTLNLSPQPSALLNSFEENLSRRLRNLIPKSKDEVFSFTWMKLAMELLSETHNDIKILITELDLPPSDWNEELINVYLDVSVKVLDICIAFSSEISRLNQSNLILKCALHHLDSKTLRAHSSLDKWRNHISSKNSKVDNCSTIIDSLVKSLHLPKVKNSAKGKVLMRAMCGVKVQTVYICSVFASAFSGSVEKLLKLNVSGADNYMWAQAFTDLQRNVNGEIANIYSTRRLTPLKELEAVDLCVKRLATMIQNGTEITEANQFKNFVSELGDKAEQFSRGLDLLTKEVDGFFQIVLDGRDALLSTIRASVTM